MAREARWWEERDQDGSVSFFHNHLRVSQHHSCCILLVTQNTRSIMEEVAAQKLECQETEIIGSHFKGWSHQESSRIDGGDAKGSENLR